MWAKRGRNVINSVEMVTQYLNERPNMVRAFRKVSHHFRPPFYKRSGDRVYEPITFAPGLGVAIQPLILPAIFA